MHFSPLLQDIKMRNHIRTHFTLAMLLPQGQPARVLNALDLMRNMTLDAETSSTSNSLETVPEVKQQTNQHHQGQPGTPKKTPTKKPLTGRRTSSTSAVTAAVGGGNLRSPSTSALTGKSSGQHRSRSLSLGSKLGASPRRPNTSYVRTPDRKHS